MGTEVFGSAGFWVMIWKAKYSSWGPTREEKWDKRLKDCKITENGSAISTCTSVLGYFTIGDRDAVLKEGSAHPKIQLIKSQKKS